MRLRRRRTPPGLVLSPGERVLAVSDGDPAVVATSTALHLPAGDAYLRLPWERIDHATWDEDDLLDVHEVDGTRHRLRLTGPGSVPEAVRERVTATVVVSTHVDLDGGGVRIAGRRPLGGDGDVRWSFVFDAGLDPDDPGLRAQAERALAHLRCQTGL